MMDILLMLNTSVEDERFHVYGNSINVYKTGEEKPQTHTTHTKHTDSCWLEYSCTATRTPSNI